MTRPCFAPLLLALSLFVGCATAPTAPSPGPAGPPKVSLFCTPNAKRADFAALGVPQGERPVAVALNESYIYVRFEPARLLRMSRAADGKVDMLVGSGEWQSMSLDPRDGSIWLAKKESPTLVHVTVGFNTEEVNLQKVEGAAGLHQLMVTKDVIYASPGCVPGPGLWRIDRSGKVLGTALPAPAPAAESREPKALSALGHKVCALVSLVHDQDGGVVAHDWRQEKSYRLQEDGGWNEQPIPWLDDLPHAGEGGSVVKGVDVGRKSEQWYLGGYISSLFFFKGTPVFLGGQTTGRNDVQYSRGNQPRWNADTVLLIRDGAAGREVIERCGGQPLWDVATDATTYAAITPESLIWGDLAKAPDLPR